MYIRILKPLNAPNVSPTAILNAGTDVAYDRGVLNSVTTAA